MRHEAIFAPMVAFSLLVFVLWLRLGFVRVSAGRRGVISPEYLKLGLGQAPPDAIVGIHHHFSNLFEVPVLFYAACLSLFVLGRHPKPANDRRLKTGQGDVELGR